MATRGDEATRCKQAIYILDRLLSDCGFSLAKIRVNNGPEFISRALDLWACINGVTFD